MAGTQRHGVPHECRRHQRPGPHGWPYRDRDGNEYLPLLRQPVRVLPAGSALLAAARERALGRGLPAALSTRDLSATGHDEANTAAVAAVPARELDLVGPGLRGRRTIVDRIVKGARKHG